MTTLLEARNGGGALLECDSRFPEVRTRAAMIGRPKDKLRKALLEAEACDATLLQEGESVDMLKKGLPNGRFQPLA